MPKEKALPRTLAQCADLLYTTREERLRQQKAIDALASLESRLRERIIAELPKSQASGISGKTAHAQIDSKQIPRVAVDEATGEVGWPVVYEFIRKKRRFDLLQRRLNEAAVKEMWDEGVEVPGIERFNVVTVSCTKLKKK